MLVPSSQTAQIKRTNRWKEPETYSRTDTHDRKCSRQNTQNITRKQLRDACRHAKHPPGMDQGGDNNHGTHAIKEAHVCTVGMQSERVLATNKQHVASTQATKQTSKPKKCGTFRCMNMQSWECASAKRTQIKQIKNKCNLVRHSINLTNITLSSHAFLWLQDHGTKQEHSGPLAQSEESR